jgi:ABC-type dipeptide/oligopeptide/nickel transport system ATPase subunit
VKLDGEILFSPKNRKPLSKDRRRRIQMVFQDPQASLNPRLTIGDQLTEGLVEHRLLNGETRDAAAARLLAEVGLDESARWKYPFEFSGGQRQRICIARALALRPDLVVGDEVVSALDVSVQAQVINLLMDLRKKHGLAYVMIGHDLSVLRHVAHRIAVMYLGRLAEVGRRIRCGARRSIPTRRRWSRPCPCRAARAREKRWRASRLPRRIRCRAARSIRAARRPADLPNAGAACRVVDGHRVWCHLYPEQRGEDVKTMKWAGAMLAAWSAAAAAHGDTWADWLRPRRMRRWWRNSSPAGRWNRKPQRVFRSRTERAAQSRYDGSLVFRLAPGAEPPPGRCRCACRFRWRRRTK